jgi:hypothetical protein
MTELRIQISNLHADGSEVSLEGLSSLILKTAAIGLYKAEQLSLEQASKLAGLTSEQFLRRAGQTPIEPPGDSERLLGSRYLARVLWALFEGEKQSLTPMTAAEIAQFVSSNSTVKIQETNTARFFRDCRKSGQFEHLWSVVDDQGRRRYTITEMGRDVLLPEELRSKY